MTLRENHGREAIQRCLQGDVRGRVSGKPTAVLMEGKACWQGRFGRERQGVAITIRQQLIFAVVPATRLAQRVNDNLAEARDL